MAFMGCHHATPPRFCNTLYVFLIMSPRPEWSHDEYRAFRNDFLENLCDVVIVKYPDATDVVGIATEPKGTTSRSLDIVYADARKMTAADRASAQAFADCYEVLQNGTMSFGTEYDYPDPRNLFGRMPFRGAFPRMKGRQRNDPCLCGSGKKFKKCCGPRLNSQPRQALRP
jgi:hypothetical protein